MKPRRLLIGLPFITIWAIGYMFHLYPIDGEPRWWHIPQILTMILILAGSAAIAVAKNQDL